ncbi:hypothetical protein ONA02_06075 [Mycoplasmopsis felis]|uniref:hypothetical protein n=1 Tax=Mycoplasmopsis felis TaxID=33923 RepID=UPI00228688D2|nr:hypothetical protein [Mycoplasmopsis felis]WAM02135.1 hypothetical protein ONA02_06075 [Mycoplasmopsis felis]
MFKLLTKSNNSSIVFDLDKVSVIFSLSRFLINDNLEETLFSIVLFKLFKILSKSLNCSFLKYLSGSLFNSSSIKSTGISKFLKEFI